MRGSLLLCVQPQSRYTADLKEDASLFFASIVDGLKRLNDSLAEESVSLKWSTEVMELLKNMQTDLLSIFKKFDIPICLGSDEDWFEQYMQETAILLDFCNTLKAAISRFNRYCMIVDFAVQMFVEGNPLKIVDFETTELNKSERCHERFSDMKIVHETIGVKYNKNYSGNRKCDDEMVLIMLVTKTTMLVLSWILVSSMVSPVSVETNGAAPSTRIEIKPCFDLLSVIVKKVGERSENAQIGILEHEMVTKALRDLKGQLEEGVSNNKEKVLKDLEKLRERSIKFKEGVERFSLVLHEVFDEVIKGRNEMLGIFRDKALTLDECHPL